MQHDRALQVPSVASRIRRAWTLPSLRQAWFQLHWLIGVTAGSVLVVIGVSGAVLSFRDEILDAINPGVRHVAVRSDPVLSPTRLLQAAARARPEERVGQITLFSEPGAAARVNLAPPAGRRRGETVYLDPYSGALQPALQGADFFEWVEQLHRWLLLPRDAGKVVGGALAACLLVMALSGLYLRWPRRPLAWRQWLTFDVGLKGRPFLWGLHAVVGTFALVIYLVSTSTGIYWAFDVVRDTIDGWAGVARVERPAAPGRGGDLREGGRREGGDRATTTPPVAFDAAWKAFTDRAGDWRLAQIRVPERATQPVQISWLAGDAPHERARSRMVVRADGGDVTSDERYESGSTGARALSTIYPLHMGSYFGLVGRLVTMLASLSLPVFAVTGWMMYLGRRTQKRAARLERIRLNAGLATQSPPLQRDRDQPDPVLVVYATQTGHAERLALRSAGLLQRGGIAVVVQSLSHMTPAELATHARVLVVAASFGEGEPPDGVRRFMRRLDALPAGALARQRYGLLALGDRNYARFCGFGHALDDRLQALGASPLFPMVEVHDNEPDAIARWSMVVADLAGVPLDAREEMMTPATAEPPQRWQRWTLVTRELLNEGSIGGPLYEVALSAPSAASWLAGALVEVLPRQGADEVATTLGAMRLDGATPVIHADVPRRLDEALALSERPATDLPVTTAQALVDRLAPLLPRRYSVASLPEDGALRLLVRQERHPRGLGVASGWLTAFATPGCEIDLRFCNSSCDNPSFAPATGDVPCIYIGNGSGLAGLRAHLRARVRDGRRRNWLLFGERQQAHDRPCGEELRRWIDQGFLARLDLAFSRDGGALRYVQDHLRGAAVEVRAWMDDGAVVYVCGSLRGMASGVDDALAEILGRERLEELIAEGRYRRDIY